MASSLPETYVETRMVPVEQLRHLPGNPNRGDVPKLRGSLQANGQYRALVVREKPDGELVILAGNHTFDALVAEGAQQVRCEIHHCDDQRARKIALGDNRYPEFSHRDMDLLLEALDQLDGDYAGSGYTEEDVSAFLTPPDPAWFDNNTDSDGGGGGLGLPGGGDGLSFVIHFDSHEQRQTWMAWLEELRHLYPDLDTIGARIAADLERRDRTL